MVDVPGFKIQEELGHGSQSIVYRATCDGGNYAVKVLSEPGSALATRRMWREIAALAGVNHPGVVAIRSSIRTADSVHAVMDLCVGQTLAERIQEGPVDAATLRSWAESLADALGAVHAAGIVHGDLKPANIFLDTQSGPRLIDFGLTERLDARSLEETPLGTLLYSPPERLGLLRRPIDGRSDLYSLGAILFEALAARPPFAVASAEELIRQHAAVVAPDVRQFAPDTPADMAMVIATLLAKDPDDRIPEANVVRDLFRAESLPPGTVRAAQLHRYAPRPAWATSLKPLVGRSSEMDGLRDAWKQARSGRGSVVCIRGDAGHGKGGLARTMAAEAQEGALALVGGCVEGDATPFGAMRTALDEFVSRLYVMSPEEAEGGRRKVESAAGDGAPLVRHLSPRLGEVLKGTEIGERVDLTEQFFAEAANFVVQLAKVHSACLLVIENVQWCDAATMRLLELIVTNIQDVPLLILCTADASAPPMPGERAIHLRPLNEGEIAEIAGMMLGGESIHPDVVERVFACSHGNRFAAEEYLRAMLEAGYFSFEWGTWALDANTARSLQLPEELLQLILQRLEHLDDAHREVLSVAALLGEVVSIEWLATAFQDRLEVAQGFTAGLEANVIEPSGGSHVRFVHTQLRDALIQEMSESLRVKWHTLLATALTNDPDSAHHVYEIARHMRASVSAETAATCFEALITAAASSVETFATEDARSFMLQAEQVAEEFGIARDGHFFMNLGTYHSKVGYFHEAEKCYARALDLIDDPLGRAEVQLRRGREFRGQLRTADGREALHSAFREMGALVPMRTFMHTLRALVSWFVGLLRCPRAAARPPADPRVALRNRVLAGVYEEYGLATFYDVDPVVLLQCLLRLRLPAMRTGPSRSLMGWQISSSVIFSLMGWRRTSLKTIDRAAAMANQLGGPVVAAHVSMYRGYILDFLGDTRLAGELLSECAFERGRLMESTDFIVTTATAAVNMQLRGQSQQALDLMGVHLYRLESAGRGDDADWAGWLIAPTLATVGRVAEARNFIAPVTEERLRMSSRWEKCQSLSHKIATLLELGDVGTNLDEPERLHKATGLSPRTAPMQLSQYYVFLAYARFEALRSRPEDETAQAALTRALADLWMVPHPALRSHKLVIRSLVCVENGQIKRAEKILIRAEQMAEEQDDLWVLFEIERLRARIAQRRGRERGALRHAHIAYEIAGRQGWLRRAESVGTEFSVESHAVQIVSSRGSSRAVTSTKGAHTLRVSRYLDALLQVSLSIASQLDDGALMRVALDEIVRIFGAERSFLFLTGEGTELEIRAGRDGEGRDIKDIQRVSRSVLKQVMDLRKPIVSGTASQSVLVTESIVEHSVRSIIAAPLVFRDKIMGVVYVDHHTAAGMFDKEDLQILQAVANHIAVALETARTARLEMGIERERALRVAAEGLRTAVTSISSSLDPAEVTRLLYEALAAQVSMEGCFSLSKHEGAWQVTSHFNAHEQGAVDKSLLASDADMLNRIDVEGRPQQWIAHVGGRQLPAAGSDPQMNGSTLLQEASEGAAWLGVPMAVGGRKAGIVVLQRGRESDWAPHEIELLSTLVAHGAMALENARYFAEAQEYATTDILTGLNNRRQFFVLAEQEVKSARRARRPYCVVMIDVDHFKSVNDNHGHGVGDEVLAAVAASLRAGLRDSDILGRYGGEEFALLLPAIAPAMALEVVDRLRARIAKEPIITASGPLAVSFSAGLTTGDFSTGALKEALERADQALYGAKHAGRNRVEVASS